MQYWKYVDAGEYVKYSPAIFNIFLKEKRYFEYYNPFWNPVKQALTREIVGRITELSSLEFLYGEINEIAVLVLTGNESTLHIDHTIGPNTGVKARLNIPVVNCENSKTCFYEMDEQTFSMHATNWEGTKHWGDELKNSLTPTTTVILNKPTILRTSVPHTVFCDSSITHQNPRVALTISFKEDIVKLLE